MRLRTPTESTLGQPAGEIGFWTAVALVMGNMIGSGIFLLPASLAGYGGLSLVGWVVSTAGAILLALVFARLAQFDPAAGGPYAYTRRSFGDLAGFLVGWGYWISIWSSLAAIAVAFVGYLEPFFPALVHTPASAALLAVGTMWLLIVVNILGVRTAGRVQLGTTLVKILPLFAVGLVGLTKVDPAHFAMPQGDARAMAGSLSAVSTLTLWAFLGLESATVPSGSIRDPDRTIPRATVTGTLLAAVIYILGTAGVMSVLAPAALGRSTAPFADAASMVAGEWAGRAVALGAAVSCAGALNGWTLLVGQLPLAVARDGLFPRVFARISHRGTPALGMVIAGVLSTALVAMNYTRGLVELYTFIILLSTLSTLVPYVFSTLAGFMMDRRMPLTPAAALVASMAFVYSMWAIAGAGVEVVYWGFLLLLAGLPVYVTLIRQNRTAGRS